MRLSDLEKILSPMREEYRAIVNSWIASGLFGVTYPALLVETYHYVKHSSSLMSIACARLTEADEPIQSYLARHIGEEVTHEQWALNDLNALGYNRDDVRNSLPLPETINLIGSQLYVATYLHPAALIGYVYLMESMPPSEKSLAYLEECGVPRDAMTFLSNHGKTDLRHREELGQVIEEYFHARGPAEEALCISASVGLSDLNRLLQRIKSGKFVDSVPMISTQISNVN